MEFCLGLTRMAEMSTSATALRSAPGVKHQRSPISRDQVESVISRSVALFGIVFGAQTIPPLIAQLPNANPVWSAITIGVIALSLVASLAASVFRRYVRLAHAAVAVIYLAALQTWPLFVTQPGSPTTNHWLYFLLTVATASAAIGLPTAIGTTYLLVLPVMYGLIRVTPDGGMASAQQAILDSLYSVILGGVIMVIVTMLRQASASVDAAQANALERYSHAVRAHATEIERVQVDSIVHDSVLTTLLSAARAFTPDAKALAATMAGNAIGHLREAALVTPDDGSTVVLTSVARRISEAANTIGAKFELRTRTIGTRSMPIMAAEAVYSASVQAMVNSLQHAGAGTDVSRWLTIRGIEPAGIEVEVGDTGGGFAYHDVPKERLGLRVSIVERVSNAGGCVEIDSVEGEGTVITIRWPHTESADADPGEPAGSNLRFSGGTVVTGEPS